MTEAMEARVPEATRDRWLALVAGVLRKTGALPPDAPPEAAEELLTSRTPDGIAVRPLYTADDAAAPAGQPGLPPYLRGANPLRGRWAVRALHEDPDPELTARETLADLELGATELWLRLGPDALAVDDLPAALHEVLLDLAPVVLDAGADYLPAAGALLRLVDERGVPPERARGGHGADPFGLRARTGRPAELGPAVELAARLAESRPGLRALTVDALPYHEAGGTDGQELGASIAAGVGYLRALRAAGLDVDAAFGTIEFRYAATPDQFATIAKLRAARRLWAEVGRAVGAAAPAQRQHAVTSKVAVTRHDPWVNLLRGTVAAFAAGVGGADAVTVLPFDTALGLPDAFSRRIARNTQALLLDESHLAAVADPGGGSWYLESLTDELAAAGWAFFTEIEASGGMGAALDSGHLAERLAAARRARDERVAHRAEPVTGVSEFPNLDEELPDRVPRPQPEPPAAGALPSVRRSEPFEALRDRSDAVLAATGRRPRAFLLTLGPLAGHAARLAFAENLLRAGGVEPVTGPDPDAYRAAGAPPVAVLCGPDALYPDAAEPLAAELTAAGARRVLLAGRPGTLAGVDGYLYTGCDALAALRAVHDAAEEGER